MALSFARIISQSSESSILFMSIANPSVERTSGGIHISQIGTQLAGAGGVRDYLKQWSNNYQREQKDNAPSEVTPLGRRTLLPNSLFVTDKVVDKATPIAEDEEVFDDQHEQDGDVSTMQYTLLPGDAFFMQVTGLKMQFALYLGHVGAQAQYLLADGRWYVSVRTLFNAHIVHNLATEHEMAKIRVHTPAKPVEVSEAESGGQAFASVFGEVPFEVSSPVLSRFAILHEEGEDFRREHARALEQLYDKAASEREFRHMSVHELVRQYLGVEFDLLNEGSKIVLMDKLREDPRFSIAQTRAEFSVQTLPKHMARGASEVTSWARAYQDAAARAASGKDVSQDLKNNPLTNFISKARRIITQSRKIRSPTAEGDLGPTRQSVVPPDGGIVRKPTGESFDDNEKKIVQFLYSTYCLRPFLLDSSNKGNESICSMILRAIGAYPKYNLNADIGTLFLKELGCVDPWAPGYDSHAAIPLTWLGLNEAARIAAEKQLAAVATLKYEPGNKQPPFPDTMAHLRRDWGDMEVFCVDDRTTHVVDDAISVEASDEFPGHHWIHVHIAHPSAFIPVDHPLLEKAYLMGSTAYTRFKVEQILPFAITETLSVQPNGPVITTSTLLAPDGSVKDIQVAPGTVRNVIHINKQLLDAQIDLGHRVANEYIVSHGRPWRNTYKDPAVEQPGFNDYNSQQKSLIATHLDKFKLISDLVSARWDARKRENPAHLRMLQVSKAGGDVFVHLPADTDLSYERIFRSEHCYGDPAIRVRATKITVDATYDEQPKKYHPVAGCMLLAAESLGAWARPRQIPALYRYQAPRPGYDLNRLNNLGQHEGYLGLLNGDSVSPAPYLMLNMAQMLPSSSPLRNTKDLINQYQIDAYLKAEAAAASTSAGINDIQVSYPWDKQGLMHYLNNVRDKVVTMANTVSDRHWKTMALYRAFHYGEAQLPEILDVQIGNTMRVGKQNAYVPASLAAFDLPADLTPSDQGWEKQAKFRQFLPVKIQSVDLANGFVHCIAVGPPTDEPRIKDLVYPELRPQEDE
ncbi:3'-5' RNA exonuclease complex component [Knufia obscura]|uniref:3'-5' RNA exonuclease complex component n=1 Tax=Knufia obscura TaxID=1635080 RepID=A0ABR0RXV2_9EURO|nr:3'-5' RNA exonuclease complex component [Knufia obscura]